MASKSAENGYRDVLKDERSLAVFMRNMAKFDRFFCEAMTAGVDFTLRFEVRGNQGELIHCRVGNDAHDRPPGVERAIDRKKLSRDENW
jgi:hypothetical protein